MVDMIKDLLADRNVQYVLLGIGGLIALSMLFNFIVQIILISKGLYKQVERRRVDWNKVKGGLTLIMLAVLAYYWQAGALGFWLALFIFLIYIGVQEVMSGLLGAGTWIRWRW